MGAVAKPVEIDSIAQLSGKEIEYGLFYDSKQLPRPIRLQNI